MHPFPKTDLTSIMMHHSEVRALALIAALRFVAETDMVHAGIDAGTLARLAESDLVFILPIQRTLVSSRPVTVFALRRAGALTLARAMDVDSTSVPSDTLSSCRRSIMFLDHTLARSRFALMLTSAVAREGLVRLRSWTQDESELEIVATASRGTVQAKPLVPDAVAVIESDDRDEALIIEIDRGTERPSYMGAKYAAYAEAWRSGLLARRFGTSAVRIATVAPGNRRVARLMDAAKTAVSAAGGSGLFWFAAEDELIASGITSRVWRTMKNDACALWKP